MQQTFISSKYLKSIKVSRDGKSKSRRTIKSPLNVSYTSKRRVDNSVKSILRGQVKYMSPNSMSPRFNSPCIENQVKILETIRTLMDSKEGPERLVAAFSVFNLIAEDTKTYKTELDIINKEFKKFTTLSNESLEKELSHYIYEAYPGNLYLELSCTPEIPYLFVYQSLIKTLNDLQEKLNLAHQEIEHLKAKVKKNSDLEKIIASYAETDRIRNKDSSQILEFNNKLVKQIREMEQEVRYKQKKIIVAQLESSISTNNDKDKLIREQRNEIKGLINLIEKLEGEKFTSSESVKIFENNLKKSEAATFNLRTQMDKMYKEIEKYSIMNNELEIVNSEMSEKIINLEEERINALNPGDYTPRPNMSKVEHLFGNTKLLSTKQKVSHLVYLLKKQHKI